MHAMQYVFNIYTYIYYIRLYKTMLHDYIPRTVRHNTNIIIYQCSVYWWESLRMDVEESVCIPVTFYSPE